MDRATITLVDFAKCDLFFLLKSRMSRNIAKVSEEYIENHQEYGMYKHYVSHDSIEIKRNNTQSKCISIKNLPIYWLVYNIYGRVLFEGRIWNIWLGFQERNPMNLHDCDIDKLESETYATFLKRQLFHDYIIADLIQLYNLFKQGNKDLMYKHIAKHDLKPFMWNLVSDDDFVQTIKNYAIKRYKDHYIDEEIARFLVEYIDKPFTKIPSVALKKEYL